MTELRQTELAEPIGQLADFVAPAGEGRLHVQLWPDGSATAHLDQLDPARGPLAAVGHLFLESRTGAALVLLGALVAFAYLDR